MLKLLLILTSLSVSSLALGESEPSIPLNANDESPLISTIGCIRGAVITTYNLNPNLFEEPVEAVSETIRKASTSACLSQGFVASFLGGELTKENWRKATGIANNFYLISLKTCVSEIKSNVSSGKLGECKSSNKSVRDFPSTLHD